jgi:hypothetical protein
MTPANPPASLRSEDDEISAVEMMRRGKRGKLKGEFPPLSTALGYPAQSAGFPPFHRAGGGLISTRKEQKNEAKTQFQLTFHGHFPHYDFASVASLRSRLFRRRKRLSRSHRNHLSPSSEFTPVLLHPRNS